MLQKLADQIAECLARAPSAEERAAKSTDADLKANHIAMARQWVHMARSFLVDAEKYKNEQTPESPAA
jgi:hypothetical protein